MDHQNQPIKKQKNNKPEHQKRFFSENHSFKKRPTSKPYQRKEDIYVTNKSNFKAQINQCETILNTENTNEIFLHCVGNAISRGINLALTLVANSNNGLGYEANTSFIELIDDFHPLHDDEDFTLQKRLNSCLHIRIYRHSKNIINFAKMFKLSELVKWLGLSEFEIFTNLLTLWIFTMLLSIRLGGYLPDLDWFGIFSPLFCSDLSNGYFCVIVGIRMFLNNDNRRKSFNRFFWSLKFLILTVVFKYLLCRKLSGEQNLDYFEVFAPLFVLLQLIAVRACQLSNAN
ncbi:Transmembrane protein [Pseudolycoriella hygida]|uniref:Transmembrane protein n=1 Tax=Pseudolycoriella hygida TaxID=35572 RepID=A0A9Q0MT44_9DIPT|nr:Transmembrane protein [Pseudolycoriella hygida]